MARDDKIFNHGPIKTKRISNRYKNPRSRRSCVGLTIDRKLFVIHIIVRLKSLENRLFCGFFLIQKNVGDCLLSTCFISEDSQISISIINQLVV